MSAGARPGGVDGSSPSVLPALPSSRRPDQPPLPFRLLGRGESRSMNVEGTGSGLVFLTGMRDVTAAGRMDNRFEASLSAATSSGVRSSKSVPRGPVSSSAAGSGVVLRLAVFLSLVPR